MSAARSSAHTAACRARRPSSISFSDGSPDDSAIGMPIDGCRDKAKVRKVQMFSFIFQYLLVAMKPK